MDFFSYGLAFLEGLALIVSPCILPILPIVLSVGMVGGKARPYGLILGFILSFWTFTLLSRKLVMVLGIDTGMIRQLSFIFLLALGILMLSDKLSDAFGNFTQNLANAGQKATQQSGAAKGNGFLSGFLAGLFVGLIWSPCVGPIIAVVLVQTIRQTSDAKSALLLASFSLGVGLPMLLITLGGQTVLSKFDRFKRHTGIIRKSLGGIIIATVLYTAGADLFKFPSMVSESKATPTTAAPRLVKGLAQPYDAPNFSGISTWINSPPLTMSQLKGKVVLVDFWTYSCINCVRTLPVITGWDQKYRSQGLMIVGVHSPEFDFEKNVGNVQTAVKQHNIHYPVAMDNNLDTFTGFKNQYWPAHYLIDRSGKVVYTHFGEGEYQQTENNIRALLGVSGKAKTAEHNENQSSDQTPETYLGYERGMNFSSPQAVQRDQVASYTFPKSLPLDGWALNGSWKFNKQQIVSSHAGDGLRLHFTAKKVFLVLGTENKHPVKVTILLNEKPVPTKEMGQDVKNGQLIVDKHTLYELLNLNRTQATTLELQVQGAGLSAYAFTFGN